MRPKWLPAILVALALPALGQAASQTGPVFQVDFSNPDLSPKHWTLILHPDGSGHFSSERRTAPIAVAQTIDAPNIDRDVQVSAEFADRVFQTARNHKFFHSDCESHMKVAFQGWKKFGYTGPEGQGSCEFNFARDKDIQALGDSLVAVAETIVEGARLEMLLLHDPLGLDHEMEYLMEAAGDGRVQQIGAIRGILERLAKDEGVIERVRKRARLLLARAEG
ncbi:MAG: hypothetical protein ABSD67_15155 [Terracidiphilus sp.]|jgi:hypothetical protein